MQRMGWWIGRARVFGNGLGLAPGFSKGVLAAVAAGMLAGFVAGCRNGPADTPTIRVYKTPTCGCCSKWIDHLEAAGFEVEATDLPDLASLKRENGVPAELGSCHTALIDGYVLEGHVPAEDIERLLAERPAISGLAVPDMPLGSPGMEHPDPARHQPFDVMAFGRDGVRVFASHPAHSAHSAHSAEDARLGGTGAEK